MVGKNYDMAGAMTDWNPLLRDQFEAEYWKGLQSFVAQERKLYTVYPPHEDVFACLNLTAYAATKVMILGQDPYHGPNQAHGLCFSVRDGIRTPPSLANVYKELQTDIGIAIAGHGNLEAWAKQGVLLLNTTLTVRAGQAASHQKHGWETFTDRVIEVVSAKEDPVVFILWGNSARRKQSLIDTSIHTIIESAHPSPLSARNGFFGSRPFSRANKALVAAGRGAVEWDVGPSLSNDGPTKIPE
jgi:uracil-DNA glycosylase